MEPKALFDFLLARRTSQGIAAVPLEEAPRRMIRALRAGEVVAIAGDRNLGGKPARVRFFGRDADLPRSPASLALHTGAPLVLGVGIRAGYNHYRGLLTRIEMTPRAGGPRQEQEIAQSLAWALEPIVRSFPDQWLAFSPVWPDGAPGKDAATMNQQRKVAT
jgi:KDO2-lipid IV(A) lauroyltransferase